MEMTGVTLVYICVVLCSLQNSFTCIIAVGPPSSPVGGLGESQDCHFLCQETRASGLTSELGVPPMGSYNTCPALG